MSAVARARQDDDSQLRSKVVNGKWTPAAPSTHTSTHFNARLEPGSSPRQPLAPSMPRPRRLKMKLDS